MIGHDFDLIRVAAWTHRGALRDRNEDAVALGRRILHGDMESPAVDEIDNNMRMLIVADGMGGHARGELACIIQPGALRFEKMRVGRYVSVLLLSAGHASASPVVDQRWDLHLFVG